MTHRTYGHFDREAAAPGGSLRFIAATEGVKGDGIDLRMAGARLERFRRNPVFGYGHSYRGRGDLPIGRGVSTEVDGSRLLIDVEFDQGDEFAKEVERKYRSGFLHAVSIGFDVAKWQDGKGSYWSGGVAEEWELTELSAVPVPMDDLAVVEAGRSADGLPPDLLRVLVAELGAEQVLAALSRSLHPQNTPPRAAEDVPVPPAGRVDEDAVRGLLAAFTPERTA